MADLSDIIHCISWPHTAPAVPQHSSHRHPISSWSTHAMCCLPHECQSAAPQPCQDNSHLAGFAAADRQGHYPRYECQQSADYIGTSQCCVCWHTGTYGSSDLKPWRQWFMHSSLCVLTTVTRCCLASLTICSGVFTLHHVHCIQAGSFGLQGAEWSVSAILGGWLHA